MESLPVSTQSPASEQKIAFDLPTKAGFLEVVEQYDCSRFMLKFLEFIRDQVDEQRFATRIRLNVASSSSYHICALCCAIQCSRLERIRVALI